MDEVARRARVGRPSLYKHFPGRDALIGAVVQTELAKFFAEVQSVVERYDDPDERLVHGFPTPIDCSVTTRPSAQFSDSTLRSSCRT